MSLPSFWQIPSWVYLHCHYGECKLLFVIMLYVILLNVVVPSKVVKLAVILANTFMSVPSLSLF